jgi:hypothetical protein
MFPVAVKRLVFGAWLPMIAAELPATQQIDIY